jgi:hypothetical protein
MGGVQSFGEEKHFLAQQRIQHPARSQPLYDDEDNNNNNNNEVDKNGRAT